MTCRTSLPFLSSPRPPPKIRQKAKRAKAQAKTKPASKVQVRAATRGSKTRVPRKSSFRFLRTIDYLLVLTLGFGLASFCKASQAPLLQRPLLLLHTDEGSSGMAAVWFLKSHLDCRFFHFRDIFHREWNDVTLALRRCGLDWTILLRTVVYNLCFGPWEGSA